MIAWTKLNGVFEVHELQVELSGLSPHLRYHVMMEVDNVVPLRANDNLKQDFYLRPGETIPRARVLDPPEKPLWPVDPGPRYKHGRLEDEL